MAMTKGERTELRSVVRQQFKVLKSEVEQREREVHAQLEADIEARFAEQDRKEQDIGFLINEIVLKANREINDVLYAQGIQPKKHTEKMWLQAPHGLPERGAKPLALGRCR